MPQSCIGNGWFKQNDLAIYRKNRYDYFADEMKIKPERPGVYPQCISRFSGAFFP
ncbi:hypothetical protein NBRC111894_1595 [Sporolactobacillus inulinus]|uniref:Uncharacterized protein n=1 Tax=Sporolactobacillus inulinus TaxID=2078 RepID=A0A4Y1ZAT7_9BACL|nr:hypothetical protein NBRC111894_1595 [Sporolactobacillus inulinus]